MFAVSRSASSSMVLSCSKSAIARSLIEAAYVDDQRGRAVGQDRGATEEREPVAHTVEAFHDDVLLPSELVDHEPRPPSVALDHDDLRRSVGAHEPRLRQPHDLAELQERDDLIAQQHYVPLLRDEVVPLLQ